MGIQRNGIVTCHCREVRLALGFSAVGLAERADISKGGLKHVELGGNVNIRTALTLAKVLGKSVEELWELKPVHVGGKS
jgi:DNA-binding XRE family transcriptional regulator